MSQESLVSIALCTYNGSKHLVEQVESILNQTYKNLEVIVVDDCSTDSTVGILNELANEDKRLHVHINSSSLGIIKNFEKAITLCTGKYIALSDQDDIWDLRKIETMINRIDGFGMVYHDSELINEDGKSLNTKMSDLRNHPTGDCNLPFLFNNGVPGHGLFFRKEFVKFIKPIPEDFFHDWWIGYVMTTVSSIDYIDEPLVYYRQHEKSATDTLKLREQSSIDTPFSMAARPSKRSKIAGRDARMASIMERSKIFKILYSFQHKDKRTESILRQMIDHLERNDRIVYSFSLLFLFLKYYRKFFYVLKKSKWKKIKMALKEPSGIFLKIKFHEFKFKYLD